MTKINDVLLAIFIVIFSFTVRIFYNSISSFSLDEMISIYLTKAPIEHSFSFNSPPLFYQLLKLWIEIVPSTEPFYRMLSAFFSTAATLGMGLIGYKLFSPKTGLVLMLLHSIAPLSVANSQLLVNYSLFEMLCVFQFFFFLSYIRINKYKNSLLGFSILLIGTNYLGLVLIFFQWLFLQKRRISSEKLFIGIILSAIMLPLALDIFGFNFFTRKTFEHQAQDPALLPNYLFRVLFFVSPISVLTILFLIGHYIYRNYEKYKVCIDISLSLLFLGIVYSTYTQKLIFAPRHFIFLLPILLIFLERTIHQFANEGKRKLVTGACVFLICGGGVYEYFNYMPIKSPDWSRAAATIGTEDNTLVVTGLGDYLKYPYFLHLTPGIVKCATLEEFVRVINNHNGPVWLIETSSNFSLYKKDLFELFNRRNYKLTDFSNQELNTNTIVLFKIKKN